MLASTLRQGSTAAHQETQNLERHQHRHRHSRLEPGQDLSHTIASGSPPDRPRAGGNKRKISSKDIHPPPNGLQQGQSQQPPSKYIEFQHAIEHSARPTRHQDDAKRTFRDNGRQRQVKRPMDSPHDNAGSQGATGQFQDKVVRTGKKGGFLQDFENNHSSDRPSQEREREREQFSHQPQKHTGGLRGDLPVSNAGTHRRSDATPERPRHGRRGELPEASLARSPLLTNEESGVRVPSLNQLHRPPVTSAKSNEVLTIRDILDNQEIRDHISELRRSLNSNADRRDSRAPSRHKAYINGSRDYEDVPSATSAVSAAPKRSRAEQRLEESAKAAAVRTKSEGDGIATDLSMDESLLEKKFRERLDAAIPIVETPGTGLARTTMASGESAKENKASTVAISTDSGDVNARAVVTRKQRQDLHHSSYSPTEFSDVEDRDDIEDDSEDEEEDGDQDTVELKQLDANDRHNDQSHPPPSQTQPTSSQTHAREGLWTSNAVANRYRPSSNHIWDKEVPDNDPRRDSGEISFEREVALARAKRELGASLNREGGQKTSEKPKSDDIHPRTSQSSEPTSPILSVSRLDRGRDLVLEDLVSPTRFNFASRHSSQQQQHQYDPTAPAGFSSAAPTASGHDWRSAPTFPLLSTTEDLAQLDIATGAEDRFLEMAGALGEGQAVASVLGTLKGMIRQLKTEKKQSVKANQKLQKELRKAQRDLERSRKANEKLQGADHTTQSSSHTKPGRGEKEQEAESTSSQQEKDKIARNMVAFQKRIDALEMQRAELQMREQIRAKEEADLMLLVDSDDDSEQGEGDGGSESESGSGSVDGDSEDHVDYDKNTRQIRSVCSDSEHSIKQRPHSHRAAGASRRSSARAPLASSSKVGGSKYKEDQELLRTSRSRLKSGRKRAHSKSTQHFEPRQSVEKVEEVVHVHHHVYYGDDDQYDDPSPILRSRPKEGPRRSTAAHLPNLTYSEYAEPSDGQYYTHIGTRRVAGDQPRHQPFGQHVPQPVSQPPHPSYDRDARAFRDQRIHHDPISTAQQNTAAVQPFQRSQFYCDEQEQLTMPQRTRVVTIVDGGEENPRYGPSALPAFSLSKGAAFHELGIPLSNSASSKQKKISINLRRILSLLKTHDPKRCTVCCNGGDGQDHDRRHQDHVRQSLSMLRIDGKPVRLRQKRQYAASVPRSRTTTTAAAPARPEDSESSSSTESDPDSKGPPGLNDGESHELPYPRRQRSVAAATTTLQVSRSAKNADSSSVSEQKLHVVLRELEEEVRHLRKSYSELHHDLETIGRKSIGDSALDVKGKGRSLDGGSSSVTTATGLLVAETAAAEQRRQQKKLIREQLLKVVDSLGEKTDEIMRIQEQQDQRLQNKSNNKKTPRSVQCLQTSTSGPKNDVRRSDKERSEKNHLDDDTTTATSNRDLINEPDTHGQDGQQANAEQDKDLETDTSDSQGTARPRQRRPDQKGKAPRMEQGKGQRSQSKEPEGYRHRLANGFRVPKLH
ncbi:hypothetical protein EC968_007272 [Mortierella alpina]|nr:hypothetical protein EC968_007272 [Mortierella alpina]